MSGDTEAGDAPDLSATPDVAEAAEGADGQIAGEAPGMDSGDAAAAAAVDRWTARAPEGWAAPEDEWGPDILGPGFQARTLPLHDDEDGPVVATLVRHVPADDPRALPGTPSSPTFAYLHLHGWNDYFFQRDTARVISRLGGAFYALDLRAYGRSLRDHQLPGFVTDLRRYDEDLHAALWAIRAERGDEVDLVLGGHSTGGLVATLWADRHPGALRALVLNSPWLELVSMQVITKLSAAALAGLARRAPRTRIPVKDPGIYTRTLSGWLDSDGPRPAQTEGDPFYDGWDLDPRWRRAPADIYAGWIAAVTEGHAAVAKGLDISCPVFVLTGSRRSRVLSSSVDPRAADIVLDVEGMRRRAMDLGDRVSVISVEGAIHDVLASARPARERAFRELSRWLRAYVPR